MKAGIKTVSVMMVSGLLSLAFVQPFNLKKSIEAGKKVYETSCMNCHMQDGKGLEGVFPPVAQSDFLKKSSNEIIDVLIKGQSGEIKVNGVTYNGAMPSVEYLSDQEMADVLNYIQNSWGNKNAKPVLPEQVKKRR
ncbi:cytochrome c [Sediminibacterium sp. C3]|uniref:c-type cytochrome n=1 Tax=Sediminibacterium sp. C3 TaxID=1267211 RepID=UPI0009DFB3D6|nr:cytochrome c [Sediminibacterium sp. C3]